MKHTRIDLYLNLHKSSQNNRVYSLRSRETEDRGKVFDYTSFCLLGHSTFHVSQPGRIKVRKFQRKLVHAVIRSDQLISVSQPEIMAFLKQHQQSASFIGYCPYQTDTFCLLDDAMVSQSTTRVPITEARNIIVMNDRIYAIPNA